MGDAPLIAVKTDVVMQVLVPSLYDAARERATGDGDDWLASMGFQARAVEVERFAPAREPIPWLAERLARPGATAERVARELAAEEPLSRPEPPDAPSWRIPGPGGHVRYFLARRAVTERGLEWAEPGKCAWMTGFFLHCCEAAGLPPSRA